MNHILRRKCVKWKTWGEVELSYRQDFESLNWGMGIQYRYVYMLSRQRAMNNVEKAGAVFNDNKVDFKVSSHYVAAPWNLVASSWLLRVNRIVGIQLTWAPLSRRCGISRNIVVVRNSAAIFVISHNYGFWMSISRSRGFLVSLETERCRERFWKRTSYSFLLWKFGNLAFWSHTAHVSVQHPSFLCPSLRTKDGIRKMGLYTFPHDVYRSFESNEVKLLVSATPLLTPIL